MDDKKPIAIIAVALVGLASAGIWWFSRPNAPGNTSPNAVTSTEAPIDKPAEKPVNLPPLDQMDPFLRPLLAALSSRPELAAWLATDDLVRQLAMALNQSAQGRSPARDFKVIKPAGAFRVAGRGPRPTIDPRSYQRYDGLVQTLTSIDAAAAAKVYTTIKPRLNEAFRGLGNKAVTVDQATQATLDMLLETPVVRDQIEVVETGAAGWAFANADIEALDEPQKQLLRMGSVNVEKVLAWLRAFREAL